MFDPGVLGPTMAQACNATLYVSFMALLDGYLRADDTISGVDERIEPIDVPDSTYDFIIIGGGAGGSVVANRLTENSDWNVLLIEAGPDEAIASQVPAYNGALIGTSAYYGYRTSNESYSCLSTNGSCPLYFAKALGGNTALNGMMFMRGTPADFNKWEDLGNDGWGWDDVFPYFLKWENNGEIDRVGDTYHSVDGPLSVERFPYAANFSLDIINAGDELGYGVSDDLNGDTIVGGSLTQSFNKDGVRHSAAAAYLRPIRDRENLDILLESLVTKIIIEDGVAVGVQYYKDGEYTTVNATREVILSAGAVRSPQVLLLSGVGPQQHLEDMGVDVVLDLPGVGENFHDHIAFGLPHTINEPNTYITNNDTVNEYLDTRVSPLATWGYFQSTFRLASSLTTDDDPDIHIGVRGAQPTCGPAEVGVLQGSGLRVVNLWAIVLQPKSRGRISLASNDPLVYPKIWANFLAESTDRDIVAEAIDLILALSDTDAMQAYNLTLTLTANAACSDYEFKTKDYWDCAMRQNTGPGHHAVGSCKMGPSTDSMAVVNSDLQVYGIDALRVIDASIMPQVPSANTEATTIMIAEYAADKIKDYWLDLICT